MRKLVILILVIAFLAFANAATKQPRSNLEPAINDVCNMVSKAVCKANDASCNKQVQDTVISKVTEEKQKVVTKVTKSDCATADCATKVVKDSDTIAVEKAKKIASDLCQGHDECTKSVQTSYKQICDDVHKVVIDGHVKIQVGKNAEKVQQQADKIKTTVTSTCDQIAKVACADKSDNGCYNNVVSKVTKHIDEVHKNSKNALAACDCSTQACSEQCLKSATSTSKKTEKLASAICDTEECKQHVKTQCDQAVKTVKKVAVKIDKVVKTQVQQQKDELKTTVSNTCDSVAKTVCADHNGAEKTKCYDNVKTHVTNHLTEIKKSSEDAVKKCDCVKKSSGQCTFSETDTTTTQSCVNNFIETCSKDCLTKTVTVKNDKLVSKLCSGKDSCVKKVQSHCDNAIKQVKKVAVNVNIIAKDHVVKKKTTTDVVKDSKKEVKKTITQTCDKVAKEACEGKDQNCHQRVTEIVQKHLTDVNKHYTKTVSKTECATAGCNLEVLKKSKIDVKEKTKEIAKDVCNGNSACVEKVSKHCDSGIKEVKKTIVNVQVAKTVEKQVQKVKEHDKEVKTTITNTCDHVKQAVCGKVPGKDYDGCSKKVEVVVKQHLTDVKKDCKKTLSQNDCKTDECRKKVLKTSQKIVDQKISKVAKKLCGDHDECKKKVVTHCDEAVKQVKKVSIKVDKVVKKQVKQQKKELKSTVTKTCDSVAKIVCSDDSCTKKVKKDVEQHITEIKEESKKALKKCQCTTVACASQCLKGSSTVEKKTQKLIVKLCNGKEDCKKKVKEHCDVAVQQVKTVSATTGLLKNVAVKKTVKKTAKAAIKQEKKQAKQTVVQTCNSVSKTVCKGKSGENLLNCHSNVKKSVTKYLSDVKKTTKKSLSSCDCTSAASCKTCLANNKKVNVTKKTTEIVKQLCGGDNKSCVKTVQDHCDVAVKKVKKSVINVHKEVKKQIKQEKKDVKDSVTKTSEKVSKEVCKDKTGKKLISCSGNVHKTVKKYFKKIQKDTNKALKKCACEVQSHKQCSTSSNLTVTVEQCSSDYIKICSKRCLNKLTNSKKVGKIVKKLCDSKECRKKVQQHCDDTVKKVTDVAVKVKLVKKEQGKKIKVSTTTQVAKKVKKHLIKKQKKVIKKTVTHTYKKIAKVVCADKQGKSLSICHENVKKTVKTHLKKVEKKSKNILDTCKCTEKATHSCSHSQTASTSVEKCQATFIKTCSKQCLKTKKVEKKSVKVVDQLCNGKKQCQEKVKKVYDVAVKKVTKATVKLHVVKHVKVSKKLVEKQLKVETVKHEDKSVTKADKTINIDKSKIDETVKKHESTSSSSSSKKTSTSFNDSSKKTSTSSNDSSKKTSTSSNDSSKKTSASSNDSSKKTSTSSNDSSKKTSTSSNDSSKKTSTSSNNASKKTSTSSNNSSKKESNTSTKDSDKQSKKKLLGLVEDDCSFDDNVRVSIVISSD
jgi:hypothetical protein